MAATFRETQSVVQSVSFGEPADAAFSQAFVQVVEGAEPANARISQSVVQVVFSRGNEVENCPLMDGDISFRPPITTLVDGTIYSWHVKANPGGPYSKCCTFVAVRRAVQASQFVIQVVVQNI